MGAIPHTEADWAVVHRLARMLEEQQHRKFNITQAYALFTPILCWTMQRMRKGDGRGRKFQNFLKRQRVGEAPWLIPLGAGDHIAPHHHLVREADADDLVHWPVEPFLIALRNAVAHSDDRCVVAEHEERANGPVLVGFRFKVEVVRKQPGKSIRVAGSEQEISLLGWKGDIVLREQDMRRIGLTLARTFCEHMTDQSVVEQDQASDNLREVA